MMEEVMLVGMTENMNLNANLFGFVGLAEMTFPNRIRSYFMLGSQATSEAVGASDVDLTLVFRDRFQDGELERFEAFRRHASSMSRWPLDLVAEEEERLLTQGAVNLKQSSLLLMGEDLRERIPLMPMDAWVRYCMHRPYLFMERGRSRAEDEPLRYPLAYPDAQGPLYGYDHRMHIEADGSMHRSFKELVSLTSWMSTALVALKAGQYTHSKSDAVEAYQKHVNDEWASLFSEIIASRQRWGYRVPQTPEDEAHLRALCGRMLGAENHFLGVYKEYLLAELRRGEPRDRVMAARRLGHILYPGDEVRGALRECAEKAEEPLRQEARESLSRLERSSAAS
jgi:hypothetical protein